jgi:hypothetical protein
MRECPYANAFDTRLCYLPDRLQGDPSGSFEFYLGIDLIADFHSTPEFLRRHIVEQNEVGTCLEHKVEVLQAFYLHFYEEVLPLTGQGFAISEGHSDRFGS